MRDGNGSKAYATVPDGESGGAGVENDGADGAACEEVTAGYADCTHWCYEPLANDGWMDPLFRALHNAKLERRTVPGWMISKAKRGS
jgi:hypothetical protein